MPYSIAPLNRSRVFVGDCSALVNEIIEGTRRQNLTSLLAALHQGVVRLYIPRHVLDELVRHIPEEAQSRRRPVDPLMALERWEILYAPYVRVVDVPREWARQDERVRAVDVRHSTDTPFAQLAAVIGQCWALTEDPDLVANGFGDRDRLPLLLAAANEGEISYVERVVAVPTVIGAMTLSATGRNFMRLPVWAQFGLVAASGFLVYPWHHDGRLAGRLRQLFGKVIDLARLAAPPLMTMHTRRTGGEPIWEDHIVEPASMLTLNEQVASVLARAPEGGLLARDIANHLDEPTPLSRLVPTVRETLVGCSAFVEVSRGRWMLGHALSDEPAAISAEMVVDWLWRAHRSDPVLAVR
ncbi:hypothetical protein ABZ807_32960 [Micromonospora sp. NPDC047548]|uniref:hypothetical protein n=1 Tax=Micromonospora sp. NPDC047548 TaxID=3155624 RepID=UPI0033D7AFB0